MRTKGVGEWVDAQGGRTKDSEGGEEPHGVQQLLDGCSQIQEREYLLPGHRQPQSAPVQLYTVMDVPKRKKGQTRNE